MKLTEALKDYRYSIDRNLAGFLTGKKDKELSDEDINAAKKVSDKMDMEDYLELNFALDANDSHQIEELLKKYKIQMPQKEVAMAESETIKKANPVKKRNLNVAAMIGKNSVEDPVKKKNQKDSWNRKAKHKDRDMKKLKENVMGMAPMPSINRMKTLAGISEDDIDPTNDVIDNNEDFYTDDGHMPPGNDQSVIDGNVGEDDFDPTDNEYTDDFGGLDDMGSEDPALDMGAGDPASSFAGSEPPVDGLPAPAAPVAPINGTMGADAFQQILNNLNQIRDLLDDVKVSEYKELCTNIKNLYNDVRNVGNTALQEHTLGRRLKK